MKDGSILLSTKEGTIGKKKKKEYSIYFIRQIAADRRKKQILDWEKSLIAIRFLNSA